MPHTGQTTKPLVRLGNNPNDCWEWIGSCNSLTGYGKKQFNNRTLSAHRWLYEMLFGKIPDNMVINHLCNNKKCVNPYHLEVVSQADNCPLIQKHYPLRFLSLILIYL